MKKPNRTNETEKDRVYRDYPRGGKIPSLSHRRFPFSVSLQGQILDLIPETPRPLVSWRGTPPRDSANFIMWRLARLLKFDPETVRYPASYFRPLVLAFSEDVGIPPDDGWDIFTDSYSRARVATCDGLLERAKATAESDPFTTDLYTDGKRRLLLSVCWHLSRMATDGVFWIGCRDGAALVGSDRATVARWLRGFVRDGFMAIERDGDAFHATRYRWRA